MKQILKWLERRTPSSTTSLSEDDPRDIVPVESVELPNDNYSIEPSFDAGTPDRETLMPDIYSDSHIATEPDLKILDQPSTNKDEPDGFNPYDTGVLQKNNGNRP